MSSFCTQAARRRFSPIRAHSASELILPGDVPVFFGENVRVQVGDPLLAFLRDPQISEGIADKRVDGLPEESRVCVPQIFGTLISELRAHARFPEFSK